MNYKQLHGALSDTHSTEYLCSMLRKDVKSAVSVLPEVLDRYGRDVWRAYIRISPSTEFWNCTICGFGMTAKGVLYADIYWQGDKTDGNDTIDLSKLLNQEEVVIGSNSKHGTLRIKRSWLGPCFASLADSVEEIAEPVDGWQTGSMYKNKRGDEVVLCHITRAPYGMALTFMNPKTKERYTTDNKGKVGQLSKSYTDNAEGYVHEEKISSKGNEYDINK